MPARTTATKATPAPAKRTRKPVLTLLEVAQNAPTKSEGARVLLDGGWLVKDIYPALDMTYAFAYGVAKRHGEANLKAASRRAVKAPVTTPKRPVGRPRKAAAAPAPVAKATRAPRANAVQATATKLAARRTPKAAPAPEPKAGRPSAARRQANRKTAA